MTPKVRTFTAIVSIAGMDPQLMPDLSASVEIVPADADDACQPASHPSGRETRSVQLFPASPAPAESACIALVGGRRCRRRVYSRPRPADLPTAEVTRGDFIEIVETRGDIRPFKSILITAPFQAGELLILELATNGSLVKKDDVVAKFDALTLRRTLQDRQSELRQAQAELDQAREQAKMTEEQDRTAVTKAGYDVRPREARPWRPAVLSGMDWNGSKLALGDAEQRLVESASERSRQCGRRRKPTWARASERSPRSAATSTQAERALGRSGHAPADGTVSIMPNYRASSPMGPAQEFRAGDRAWPGAQILELPDLTSIHLASRIDEADRGQLRPGQSATIRVDAVPDHEYPGTISDDLDAGARRFLLRLAAVEELRPEVLHQGRRREDQAGHERRRAHRRRTRSPGLLLIPAGAVFTAEGRRSCIAAAGRGYDVTPIDIVRRAREQVAIKRRLEPGDRLALTGPRNDAKEATNDAPRLAGSSVVAHGRRRPSASLRSG